MDLQQRINAFAKLGHFLQDFLNENLEADNKIADHIHFYQGLKHQIKLAHEHNGWFTKQNIHFALLEWSKLLENKNLIAWLSKYNFKSSESKKVAVIMAGNIPLVGFHDFLSVLICGHEIIVKQSSNDLHLLPYLAKYLEFIEPEFKGKISFTEGKLTEFDSVIATGSNNTARYFEHYFRAKPSIIRKNRNSVAVLTGNETDEELRSLSEDILRYYGLGCRSVSKLFVPEGYNFDAFFNGVFEWHPIIHDNKYANNYDYNKAVYIMSEYNLLENGFLMLKEDQSYSSPIATLFYEYYRDVESLKTRLQMDNERVQCIVSNGVIDGSVNFGETQHPQLWDFADNTDTIAFLLKL